MGKAEGRDHPAGLAAAAEPVRPTRKPRADGRRNNELLVETAKQLFAERGADISLDMIARRAGLGIGTLYRHFPTRSALVEEVCRHDVDQLSSAAPSLLNAHPPGEALHRWMRLCIDYIATQRVLAAFVLSIFGLPREQYRTSAAQITDNPVFGLDTAIYRSSRTLVIEALKLLTDRAIAAGEIRGDVEHMDIIRAIAGFTITYGDNTNGWQTIALRLVDIFNDGLRQVSRSGNETAVTPAAPERKPRAAARSQRLRRYNETKLR